MIRRLLTSLFSDSRARFTWGLFVLGVAARWAVMVILNNYETTPEYETRIIVPHMLAGRGVRFGFFGAEAPTSTYPLPYLLWLAAIKGLFGDHNLPVELAQGVLGAAVVFPLVFLGRALGGDLRIGRWAAFAAALYPVHVYYACRIQAVVFDTVLIATVLALGTAAWLRPHRTLIAGLGVTTGVLLLSRYQLMPYLVGVGLGWWGYGDRARRRMLLFTALIASSVVAPWTIRNAIVHRAWVPVFVGGGYNLWVGNNPAATGAVYARDGKAVDRHIPPPMLREIRSLPNEHARDQRFRRYAIDHIRSDPIGFLARIPKKVFFFWWFDPYLPTDYAGWREAAYLPLLIGFGWGAVRLRRDRRFWPIWGLPLYFTAVYAVFFATARFRYLIEPEMMVIFASAAVPLVDRIRFGGPKPAFPPYV